MGGFPWEGSGLCLYRAVAKLGLLVCVSSAGTGTGGIILDGPAAQLLLAEPVVVALAPSAPHPLRSLRPVSEPRPAAVRSVARGEGEDQSAVPSKPGRTEARLELGTLALGWGVQTRPLRDAGVDLPGGARR